MPEEPPITNSPFPADLRARLVTDIAAGKTISLASLQLEDPRLRERLPQLLEELSGEVSPVAPGLVVPGYTILAAIGQGGMSTVYLARHDALGRRVALKVGAMWRGNDEKTRRRLLEEARLLARVRHTNIVTIHDVIAVNDTIVIAMEWIDGLTLAELLRQLPSQPSGNDMAIARRALDAPPSAGARFATTSVRFFVRLVHDIARALHDVHQAGMMHLDVKPSNVLLRRDGTPLLADFGVGRELQPDKVQTRSFAGTPVYSAPEQLRHGTGMGAHTDVYGLGLTLYEALARTQPLSKLDLAGLMQATAAGRIPSLASLTPIARDLETVVHKAIRPEPAQRYPTMAAFADDLQAFLEARPVSAHPLTRTQRLRRWARNERWKAALVLVLMLILPVVLGLGVYLRVQMPRIEAMQQQERVAQANRLKQAAYRAYFSHSYSDQPSALLQQAMALEPGDTALACLMSMELEEGRDTEARAVLQQHASAMRQHHGLRMLGQALDQGRTFLGATEVASLMSSDDPVDLYVLALDRVFKAEDVGSEDAYAEAAARLADITLSCGADQMVFGLQAWCTLRAGRAQEFARFCQTMEARWPGNQDVQAWHFLSLEYLDAPAADEIARSMVEAHPAETLGWELFVGGAMRENLPDLQERFHRAEAAGVDSPQLKLWRALNAAKGNAEKAREALVILPPEHLPLRIRLRLLHEIDPEQAKQLCEHAAADPELPSSELALAFQYATDHQLPELATRLFEVYRRRFPDRVALHATEIKSLYKARLLATAAPLVREFDFPRRQLPVVGPYLCRILVAVRDWQTLARIARDCMAVTEGDDQAEVEFFRGMALSRLGQGAAAAPLLASATAVARNEKVWYANALIESAWLKVAPGGDPDTRDAAMAAHQLELHAEIGNHKNLLTGPWTSLVRAEVAFANGDAAAARQELEHAGPHRLEPNAPADTAELIDKARARYAR